MSDLVKKEKHFILLFLNTSTSQQKKLIKIMSTRQLRAIVQIVYNTLQGNLKVSDVIKKQLQRNKRVIRQFIAKGLSIQRRKHIFLKYLNSILLLAL